MMTVSKGLTSTEGRVFMVTIAEYQPRSQDVDAEELAKATYTKDHALTTSSPGTNTLAL